MGGQFKNWETGNATSERNLWNGSQGADKERAASRKHCWRAASFCAMHGITDGCHLKLRQSRHLHHAEESFEQDEGRMVTMVSHFTPSVCLQTFSRVIGRCTSKSLSHVYTPESGVTGYPNPVKWIMFALTTRRLERRLRFRLWGSNLRIDIRQASLKLRIQESSFIQPQ